MRGIRLIVLIIMCFLLIFSGCSSPDSGTSAEDIQHVYQALASYTAHAQVTALSADGSIAFNLSYEKADDKETVTVLSPEEISGIVLSLKNGLLTLSESDVALESSLSAVGVSPVEALPGFLKALSSELPADVGTEKLDGTDCTAVTYEKELNDTRFTQRIWLEEGTLAPCRGELFMDGTQVISCEILAFAG